jgi:hypothetical protein
MEPKKKQKKISSASLSKVKPELLEHIESGKLQQNGKWWVEMQTVSDIRKIKSDVCKYYVLVQKALDLMQRKDQTNLLMKPAK